MKYHDITKDDMKNGDGLRVVLWVSGCSHHCKGCQNPVTWDPEDGVLFDEKARQELFDELEKDYVSGITFSGGDPLYEGNRPMILKLLQEIKKQFPQKTIWLYTGDCWEHILEYPEMSLIDVLVDGEYQEQLRDTSLYWCGSKNQRIINVQESLKSGRVVLK
ncbi:MAG: anaerobic ribonucleoside-triphosphate reductase activating protein [Lachnospiraceae bacterium]|nr:anaerobic ribonucleoside-triphosphate reductase activating protein [Lachnospiraceae bacterium]